MTCKNLFSIALLLLNASWLAIAANHVPALYSFRKTCRSALMIRGGARHQSLLDEKALEEKKDYYETFNLDYGKKDDCRKAGFLRGFIKTGALSSLPQKDAFLKWIYDYMENGDKNIKGRLKPFYVNVIDNKFG